MPGSFRLQFIGRSLFLFSFLLFSAGLNFAQDNPGEISTKITIGPEGEEQSLSQPRQEQDGFVDIYVEEKKTPFVAESKSGPQPKRKPFYRSRKQNDFPIPAQTPKSDLTDPKIRIQYIAFGSLLVFWLVIFIGYKMFMKIYRKSQLIKKDGEYKTYYQSGRLKSTAFYKNNELHGPMKEYFEEGQLIREIHYQNGKKHGAWSSYYKTGQLQSSGEYLDDLPVGMAREFSKEGKMQAETDYTKDTQALRREFFQNGLLKSEGNYQVNTKGETKEGLHKEYYDNGNLKSEVIYRNGTQEGIAKIYYPSGRLRSEGIFKNGKIIDIKEFDENGNFMKSNK